MTERKPLGVSFESWVDKQVREAEERGDFDNLPGLGKPLPDADGPHDDNWWIKRKLASEGLSADAPLPTSLRLRKEIQRLPGRVASLGSERAVRAAVEQLNQEIVAWLGAPSGPSIPIRPVNTDQIVEQWQAERSHSSAIPQKAAAKPAPDRTPWWRRKIRQGRKSP